VVVVVVESACAVSASVPGCVGGISNGGSGTGDLLRVRRRQKQSAGFGDFGGRQAAGRNGRSGRAPEKRRRRRGLYTEGAAARRWFRFQQAA
jgi:hypothetical protein